MLIAQIIGVLSIYHCTKYYSPIYANIKNIIYSISEKKNSFWVYLEKKSHLIETLAVSSSPYVDCNPWTVVKLWAYFGSCIVVGLITNVNIKLWGVFYNTFLFSFHHS